MFKIFIILGMLMFGCMIGGAYEYHFIYNYDYGSGGDWLSYNDVRIDYGPYYFWTPAPVVYNYEYYGGYTYYYNYWYNYEIPVNNVYINSYKWPVYWSGIFMW